MLIINAFMSILKMSTSGKKLLKVLIFDNNLLSLRGYV